MATKIQNAVAVQSAAKSPVEATASQSVNILINRFLDREGMRKRFDELLGKRAPQFISSLITMVNDNTSLQKAFTESPMSVIKSALQAASYDLPIDPALGFAYIVPFNNSVKNSVTGNWDKKMAATFVIGYKGLIQLCLRTGAYDRIPDAIDVREGELVKYDRLTGDCEFSWIEDEDVRENTPIIGYAGYFRLKNGAEKTIYMSKKQIEAHEKKNRKGDYMGKGWKEDFDSMAKKTIIRKLCSKYALMSIQYQEAASDATMKMATALAEEDTDSSVPYVEYTDVPADGGVRFVDTKTGEVVEPQQDGGKLPWEG